MVIMHEKMSRHNKVKNGMIKNGMKILGKTWKYETAY